MKCPTTSAPLHHLRPHPLRLHHLRLRLHHLRVRETGNGKLRKAERSNHRNLGRGANTMVRVRNSPRCWPTCDPQSTSNRSSLRTSACARAATTLPRSAAVDPCPLLAESGDASGWPDITRTQHAALPPSMVQRRPPIARRTSRQHLQRCKHPRREARDTVPALGR